VICFHSSCFVFFQSTLTHELSDSSVVDLTPSRELLSLARSGKVLFGSDVPNVAVDLATQLSAVASWCGDDVVAKKNVLGEAADTLVREANDGAWAWLTAKGNL
jgi:hypothetical protein